MTMTEGRGEQILKIMEYESDLCLDPPSVGADDCGWETGSLACNQCRTQQILLAIAAEVEGMELVECGEITLVSSVDSESSFRLGFEMGHDNGVALQRLSIANGLRAKADPLLYP